MPLKTMNEAMAAQPAEEALTPAAALRLLGDADVAMRQRAARALHGHRPAAGALCDAFAAETDGPTREALAVAIMRTGTGVVAEKLMPLLSSENAALRNNVIEILQTLPGEVAPHMEQLLDHPDSDVRIFAVNILEALRHPKVEDWLIAVIATDRHPNVVGTALDLLGEVGTQAAIPELQRISGRFAGEPYLQFAASNAIKRIGAGD